MDRESAHLFLIERKKNITLSVAVDAILNLLVNKEVVTYAEFGAEVEKLSQTPHIKEAISILDTSLALFQTEGDKNDHHQEEGSI